MRQTPITLPDDVKRRTPWKPVRSEELDANTYRMMDANGDGQAIVRVLDSPSGERALALIASAPQLLSDREELIETLKSVTASFARVASEYPNDICDGDKKLIAENRALISRMEARK